MFEEPAVRGQRRLRIALVGPSGSGKTKTALRMAEGMLSDGQRIALLDTEHRASELYADDHEFYPAYMAAPYAPQRYIKVIQEAAARGDVGVLIIDSLSHAWMGAGGVLEQVDKLAGNKNDNRNAWKQMTPVQQELVEAIIGAPFHVISTLRTKDAYALNEKNQRVKSGLAPVQRDGLDYEMDVVLYLDQQHVGQVEKSRVPTIMPVGETYNLPGEAEARALADWLASGTPRQPKEDAAQAAASQQAGPTPAPPAAAPQGAAQGVGSEASGASAAGGDPFAASTPTPTSSEPSAPSEANAGTQTASTPEPAPQGGAAAMADPFGVTGAQNGNGAASDPMTLAQRQMIDTLRADLVKLTMAKNPEQDEAYWTEKIETRCREWYGGKSYANLDHAELANLYQRLDSTRQQLAGVPVTA